MIVTYRNISSCVLEYAYTHTHTHTQVTQDLIRVIFTIMPYECLLLFIEGRIHVLNLHVTFVSCRSNRLKGGKAILEGLETFSHYGSSSTTVLT